MRHRPSPIPALLAILLVCALVIIPQPVIGQPPAPPASPTPAASPELAGDTFTDESSATITALRERFTIAVREALADSPEGISLRSLDFDGRILTIDLSAEARQLADNNRFDEVLKPIDSAVNTVLMEEVSEEQRSIDYLFLIEGAPLAAQEPPVTNPVGDLTTNPSLATVIGQRIVINPGHGWYDDNGTWRLQRGYWFGIVEDLINSEIAIELRTKLTAAGAQVYSTRELNKAGTHPSSQKPLWQVGSAAYTQYIGAPSWVWNTGISGLDRDIMARPYYANWVNANAMISIHNNGGRGCGTETWYDMSNAYASQSAELARRIQNKIIERVRSQWDPNWCNRGVKGSNGGYAEIRAVNAPAVLIEIAFMDNESNNRALQDARFRNIVTQAISDAVNEYFSVVSCPVGTFRGEYYANTTLSGSPAFVRCDSRIDNVWAFGGPGGSLRADNFSVRWVGTHNFPGGTYAFVATGDDGLRVSVDGYTLINAWRDQHATQYRATRGLTAGNHTVVVEYYERSGYALAQLIWSRNLALLSQSYATSQQSDDFAPSRGNDGNASSRWSSRQSQTLGQEWWWVDLGNRQMITEVRINWDNAYASDYCIAWWTEDQTTIPAQQMRCYTISAPGRYVYAIGTQTARYVGVLMRRRAPNMQNYSFWEFEVYRWGGTLSAQSDGDETLMEADEQPPLESLSVPVIPVQHRVYLPLIER